MYHPAASGAEFVELLNPTGKRLDLQGTSFDDGIEFTFGPGSFIEAHGRLVVASAEDDFAAAYPGVAVAGYYDGRLDNGGERLRLNLGGSQGCTVSYDDTAPWPTTADGLGYSLVLVDPSDPSNDADNWRASHIVGGSPGSEDVDPGIPHVLINEALTHTDPPMLDAIEIYNPTDQVADLRGWLLSDDPEEPEKALIPSDERYVLRPGGYAVVDETVFSEAPGSLGGVALPGFLLSSHGGEGAFLFSTDAAGDLTGYAHGFRFEAAENGVSFGRYLTSDNQVHFVPQKEVSLGQANAGPRVGPVIFTEIHYHPLETGIEYVKLKNTGEARVDLWDVAGDNPDSTWSIDGIGFSFPAGTSLEPGAELVVANSEPDLFRSTYDVDPELAVYGPFGNSSADGTAALRNGGETITLLWPDVSDGLVTPLLVMDRVAYDDRSPWPGADGNGLALVRRDETSYSNESTAWTAQAPCLSSGECAQVQDPSDQLFDITRMIEVEIEIDPADWEVLRHQNRYWYNLIAGDCYAQPFPSPFTYFPATITFDGTRIENVGLRKKGFLGSMDSQRPSLKVKLDEYVDGQRLLGLRSLTLNNNKQDPTYLNQCLGYEVMAEAGIVVPRCNFVRVTVNQEYLGVYTHVESIKESFLQRNFASARGNLYEGSLVDLRAGWTDGIERKNNSEDPSRDDILAVVAAAEAPDEQLVSALEEVIDLDLFYLIWGMGVIVADWDGYAGHMNNYYMYAVPDTGKFAFIPWGLDQLFWEGFMDGDPYFTIGESAVYANGIIARRLFDYEPTRQRYVDTVRGLLDTVWDEEALLARIDELEALISPHILGSTIDLQRVLGQRTRRFIFHPYNPEESRRNVILDRFDQGPPPLTVPIHGSICVPQAGTIAGSFSTSWSWDWDNGTGDETLTLFDEQLPSDETVVVIGMDGDDPNRAWLAITMSMVDGAEASLWVQTNPDALASGTINVVQPEAIGWFNLTYPEGQEERNRNGIALNAIIDLGQPTLASGEVLSGTIDLPIYLY